MARKVHEELVLDFKMLNETTNTVRFTELDDDGAVSENPIMGKVYVQKWQLEKWDSPKGLEVVVRPKK